MLVGEVVAGIELEYEHMVDPRLPPAVGVDPEQEEELDEQEAATIDAHQRPHIVLLVGQELSHTWRGTDQLDMTKTDVFL